jgi:signal recognition particle subunit SEC65
VVTNAPGPQAMSASPAPRQPAEDDATIQRRQVYENVRAAADQAAANADIARAERERMAIENRQAQENAHAEQNLGTDDTAAPNKVYPHLPSSIVDDALKQKAHRQAHRGEIKCHPHAFIIPKGFLRELRCERQCLGINKEARL